MPEALILPFLFLFYTRLPAWPRKDHGHLYSPQETFVASVYNAGFASPFTFPLRHYALFFVGRNNANLRLNRLDA